MEISEPGFFIDPYIVRQGITLIWGKTSIGKSPLTWEMARAIGNGSDFFGLPAQKGRVLYIEVDTPLGVVHDRVKKVPSAQDVTFLFSNPFNLPLMDRREREELKAVRDIAQPDVVFFNTLRKMHSMDDREARVPRIVYGEMKELFPGATLVFVHHERKSSTDPRAQVYGGESFSGSGHWLNDAQSGLHLEKYSQGKANLMLYHKKSQASVLLKPLALTLERDGTRLTSPLYDELLQVQTIMEARVEKGQELDRLLMVMLGVSESTARRRRLLIEEGRFPGRGFLERLPGEEELE